MADDDRVRMQPCCINSFALMGIRTRFVPGVEGDKHQCEECGRVWRLVMNVWTQEKAH